MIEISFASSRLEGNTYDLIETQALLEYGQQAAGKSAEEARMILNHRDAIRYLLDHIDDVQIDKKTILDVHALVSNGLLAQRRDEGQVRERGVSITSSTYQPLDNRFQLEEVLEEMLEHVAHETDPFNQSLMLMVGIAYLQPFADCNKRTGRLMANLPLIKASLSPLSFITVDAANYTRGLLAYYELGFTEIISSAFVSGYIESAESYRLLAVPKGRSAEQKGFELKYRAFGTNYIKRLVRGEVSLDPELPGTVPAEDHAPLKQHLQQLVQDLHPGQAVVYGLQREEVERFLQRLSAAGGATGIQR
ncbi:MAG: cell filamentation protein Fic [Hydrocarboniphaga sp.]|nr:cell filamentation protein Fic [Hydrocarboniphaga sp.]